MISVMGAGGNTGGRIAQALLAQGREVRAIGRNEAKLAGLVKAGAQPMIGDATDTGFLARAFSGASAAYVLVAADPAAADYPSAQDELGEAICRAVHDSGIERVVALSSLGADKDVASGVVAGLRRQESRLRGLAGVDLRLLRPASFFENFTPQIAPAREHGVIADVIAPALPVPMIATRDVAAAAVRELVDERPRKAGSVVRELLGARDVTHEEVARTLGRMLGLPQLAYVQLPEQPMIEALVATGASRSFAQAYVELGRAINARAVDPVAGRTAANTNPTTLEEFVRDTLATLH